MSRVGAMGVDDALEGFCISTDSRLIPIPRGRQTIVRWRSLTLADSKLDNFSFQYRLRRVVR